MKTIKHRIILTSILTGALLFLSPALRAASYEPQPDSLPKARTQTFLPGTSGPRTFSRLKQMALNDSVHRDSLYQIHPDSLHRRPADSLRFRFLDIDTPSHTDSSRAELTADTLFSTPTESALLIAADTLNEIFPVRKKFTPSPQRATILSAVLPGLGQAYNRRYWKIPIIYAGGAALYYGYYRKNDEFLEAKRLYNEDIAAGLTINNTETKKHESDRDYARSKRDYFVIYMGILYVANVVDAMTDAYFRAYDMSDDLNLVIKPAVIPVDNLARLDMGYGLKLKVTF